jgi:hypothetical protein
VAEVGAESILMLRGNQEKRAGRSNQLEPQLAAHQRGGALQRLDRDVAFVGIEDAVDLRPAVRINSASRR